ncbi:hypothetical protein R69619_05187 [Paraburkholderia nemoris]|nr:hypothetical protein R69619_05187 [Paraburkholderia nemoris]
MLEATRWDVSFLGDALIVAHQIKSGVAATTGSQVAPPLDVGLWVLTASNPLLDQSE